ncbi:hypothetical protein ElyMa_003799700 [Elysia marginata]|uniref:ShKT domain-containing protein n=1 Tax=Elysia marginata TaxID=1093978 RepID=A0AAV4FDL2_9GAST|nr:hypothetical protein ElyMa_003799700 [Elysia marginata]
MSRCKSHLADHECRADITSTHTHIVWQDCTIDCCEDNNCVAKHFGGVYSNALGNTVLPPISTTPLPITDTTTISTTMAATTASPAFGIYSQLVQECRDHLEPGICTNLKDTQDLCKQNGTGLHLDLCPETCGVCQAIKEANCHDTVLDGECAQLMAQKDICSVSYDDDDDNNKNDNNNGNNDDYNKKK